MTKQLFVIFLLIVLLLLISPVNAKIVTAKIDDKGLLFTHSYGVLGTLHTEYGTIIVEDYVYNNVEINDTIKYDTKKDTFWSYYWDVEVIK